MSWYTIMRQVSVWGRPVVEGPAGLDGVTAIVVDEYARQRLVR